MSNICDNIVRLVGRMVREDDGVTSIEYALLASLIAIVCVSAFQATGGSLTRLYAYWSDAVIKAI